jgi:hypothetical protein
MLFRGGLYHTFGNAEYPCAIMHKKRAANAATGFREGAIR